MQSGVSFRSRWYQVGPEYTPLALLAPSSLLLLQGSVEDAGYVSTTNVGRCVALIFFCSSIGQTQSPSPYSQKPQTTKAVRGSLKTKQGKIRPPLANSS